MTAEFLLIHGSCHGAWCWRDLLPRLRDRGHAARAIDLPGHGQDPTPLGDVTLEAYARAILGAIDHPPILVGHSMAGFPITLAAELAPERIARLVYLCAYAPRDGMSLARMRREAPRQPLLSAVVKAPDGISFTIDPAQARGVFYHDCSDAAVAYAVPRLGPQPILPQETPIRLTERSTRVPRHYIRCTDDRTVPPEYQREMTRGWPEGTVSDLDCGHSPFFARPDDLADLLVSIAEGP